MERYNYNLENPEDQALDYYANNIRPYIKKLFPEGNDNTTIINGSVFVNKEGYPDKRYSSVFKKVLTKFKNYGRLENIDYDFKSKLFEVFLKESISKKNLGQFFTPIKVVRAIGEMAKDDIKPNIKICDPASGVGKFLLEPIRTKIDQLFEVKNGEIISKIQIHGFDKGFDGEEQKTIILAKANMLIYFSDLIKDNPTLTNKFSKVFNDSFQLKTDSILGTLSDTVENEYDLILTNPPYVTSGSSNLKEEISNNTKLKDYYKVNAIGVEGLFIEWIIRALKPGGKAFVIVPDGIFSRQNDKNLRQFILDECFIDGVISLPLKTFFTTPKKTYILCVTKKENKTNIQIDPVFTYLVSEIGESRDNYRFDIEQDDLSEAVNLYSFFKGNKKGFEKINTDKRCKIFQISNFELDKNWCVEKWWSITEQIELGVIEEENKTKLSELPFIIEDVANNILSFKDEIRSINDKNSHKSKLVSYLVEDIFESPPTNSGLKKIHVSQIKTDEFNIPVYSASKEENLVFGWASNDSKWKKYENVLTWNKDGSSSYVFYRKDKFIPYEKVKLLQLKENFSTCLYDYLKIVIQNRMIREGFGFNHKCSMDRVMKLDISIPYDEVGNIDVAKQIEIAEKYQKTEQIKKDISDELNKIANIEIEYE
ncbi:N-6 DNA methylase [Flavobacterium aquiphilum]|uniref:N-6 DNA methylase n=1 Tax=Flavobacterium aquiphilum TaxID=3003261 RepID=UPI0024807EB7|nr:N-6 DNA methylase [Flavobacterium aquiphilum]